MKRPMATSLRDLIGHLERNSPESNRAGVMTGWRKSDGGKIRDHNWRRRSSLGVGKADHMSESEDNERVQG